MPAKSFADLQASDHSGPREESFNICVAGDLAAEYNELHRQFAEAYEAAKENPDRSDTTRLGDGGGLADMADRLEQIKAEMEDHLVNVRLRAVDSRVWRVWRREHPPRDGEREDKALGVNVDDLVADLEQWVVPEKCEPPLETGNWAWLMEAATWGDKLGCAMRVVDLQEGRIGIPKSPTALLRTLTSRDGSK